ncbi:MAG TPA: FliH/SctL family protein [Steroidobacteraceae bacterium]|nr:FliH/SctL family protein [Steroidobacteraceae bacterium]
MSDSRARSAQARGAIPIERWALPAVEGPLASSAREERSRGAPATRGSQEAARGYEAGMARAQAEMQSRLEELSNRVRRLDAVLQLLGRPLRALDDEVEKQLLELALAVGKQLARRELAADPAQILGVLRECLEQLPLAAREVRVHLHPEDAAVVRERLAAPSEERAWSLIEDPTLARGGCVVRSDVSQIDARFESRVNAVLSSALGEQRASGRAASAPSGTPA